MESAVATATQYYDSAKTLAGGFLSNPSWDIVLVLAVLGASFFYGIMMGKRRIISSILHTYIAFAIYSVLPQEKILPWFSFVDAFIARILIFLAIFVGIYFLVGSRSSRGPVRAAAWWQVFLLSFVQVGFLFHIIIRFLPKETVAGLAPLTRQLFANTALTVWWFIIPVLCVIFLRRWGGDSD
jgi:hypothetical protein